jgi:AcrR family transcriptional regulator/DNA-binding MarR family transcriptional regulator
VAARGGPASGRVGRARRRATAGSGVRRAASSGSPGGARVQVVEVQRSRLLAAAVRAVAEVGYAEATVAQITGRARVSRRTFYELFGNREECLAAALEEIVALGERELSAAGLEGLPWCERVRLGLWRILAFLDREPVLARVCVVQLACGGPGMLRRREAILARLAAVVDEGRQQSARGDELTALTAEGLVGAAFAIMQGRLLKATGNHIVLSDLLGELMGMIVLPYLGPAAARREQQRPTPGPLSDGIGQSTAAGHVGDPLDGVAMRLTYRTARVLEGVGEHPGASNREVAECAGIADQGQVSKLLGRLERLGLLANQSQGHLKGEPNAWSLTSRGQRVAQSIRMPTTQIAKALR